MIPAEAIEESALDRDLLARLLTMADKDRGLRAVIDVRLRGRVRRAMNDREAELARREADLARREEELAASAPAVVASPEVPADFGDSGEVDAYVAAIAQGLAGSDFAAPSSD